MRENTPREASRNSSPRKWVEMLTWEKKWRKTEREENIPKSSRYGYLKSRWLLIDESKLNPNTEEHVLFTLKNDNIPGEQYSPKYCITLFSSFIYYERVKIIC